MLGETGQKITARPTPVYQAIKPDSGIPVTLKLADLHQQQRDLKL